MFRIGEPAKVIYNIHFPNEKECINKDVIEKDEFNPQVDLNQYSQFLYERYLQRRAISRPSHDEHNSTISSGHRWGQRTNSFSFSSNGTTNQRPYSTSFESFFSRNRPSASSNGMVTRTRSKSDKIIEQLKELVGENLYANNLKKAARLISQRIGVSYSSYSRKDETVEWFRTNWNKIEPIYKEFIGKI